VSAAARHKGIRFRRLGICGSRSSGFGRNRAQVYLCCLSSSGLNPENTEDLGELCGEGFLSAEYTATGAARALGATEPIVKPQTL
jgi:hypothetical protein